MINSSKAHSIGAKMTTVDLTGAVIRYAELERVNLIDVNLTNGQSRLRRFTAE